jgi:predicted esterase YcpF (UPF0227 family)
MSESEYKIINGNKILIVCFGGMALQFGGIIPFEFLNYLSSIFLDRCDLYFFVDKHQCWYHKGIKDITNNIDETVLYINNIIKNGNYEKVLFMGISAGGYAAILFGSLCNNVNNIISFIPQTILKNPINSNYSNLRNVINKNTSYFLYGDKSVQNNNDNHHISHCENLEDLQNVKIIKDKNCILKELRDNGYIKTLIESIIL